jgi:sugar/nucleoside kinase (ribokinase family)
MLLRQATPSNRHPYLVMRRSIMGAETAPLQPHYKRGRPMSPYDVYSYGVISSSTLHLLGKPFPAPDAYAEITQTYQMTGGEAANSSIVLSRLGQRVFLDGNWLGDTPEGHNLLAILQKYNIETSRLTIKKGYGGVKEIVFSDQHSRTIFGNYEDLQFTTRKWNIPRKADIARARIVCLDPPFHAETELAAHYAVQSKVPYLTLDCPSDSYLAQNAAAVIISGEYRDREGLGENLEELFREYQSRAAGVVVLTCGSEPLLYGRKDQPLQRFQPYLVDVIDSAGAGDSFRAGVAFGLLQGWSDIKTMQYASALAAIICTTFPGVLNCPTHRAVLKFIREQQNR